MTGGGGIYQQENSQYTKVGKLHLEVEDKKLIKSDICVDGSYSFDGFANKFFSSTPKLDGLKKEFGFEWHDRRNTYMTSSDRNMIVNLSLKIKRLMRSPSTTQKEMDDHWLMTKSFLKMQNQENFKDFTFQIGKEQFKIHKCVLAARSEVLGTMFMSGLDESQKNFSDSITDIDPEVFQLLVNFLYGNKEEFDRKIENYVFGVFRAAHKYQIHVLQDFCVDYITQHCTGPDRAIETFAFASLYDSKELKDLCWDTIKM